MTVSTALVEAEEVRSALVPQLSVQSLFVHGCPPQQHHGVPVLTWHDDPWKHTMALMAHTGAQWCQSLEDCK